MTNSFRDTLSKTATHRRVPIMEEETCHFALAQLISKTERSYPFEDVALPRNSSLVEQQNILKPHTSRCMIKSHVTNDDYMCFQEMLRQ